MRIEITAQQRDGLMPALASALLNEGGFFMPLTKANQSCHAPDFRVTYDGMITTITPLSDACHEWLNANVEIEPWQHFGTSIAIEPRYVEQLAEAMIEEGLVMDGNAFE
jgi:hypothetical protein